ncbi:hypothetical protein MHA_0142 [Mannheimia haemolytica PHL213]|nr:hypothetical protein MHA_0142 [Mannheimia haemolytica PHL213]
MLKSCIIKLFKFGLHQINLRFYLFTKKRVCSFSFIRGKMIHLLDQFIKLILIKFCFISHIM